MSINLIGINLTLSKFGTDLINLSNPESYI